VFCVLFSALHNDPPEPQPQPLITIEGMLDRIWWFVTGVFAGGVVTVRALRRSPQPGDLKAAAAHTTADVLSLTAKVVRPPRRVRVVR